MVARRLGGQLQAKGVDVENFPGVGRSRGASIIADMRAQEQDRFKMRTAYAVGDTATARELAEKMDPSRVTAEDIKKKFGSYAPSARGSG